MSLLEVSDLSHSFGDKALYRQSSFSLYKGEHMGVVGQNGTGKSTLIRILIGEVIPDTGSVVWQKNIGIGHLDQYAGVDGSLTIREYLRAAFSELYDAEERLNQLYARLRGDGDRLLLRQIEDCQEYLIKNDFYAIDTLIGKVATGLGLTGIGMDRKLSELSGGQREKAILAKLLLSKPDVLLLDEPTNFLDAEHIEWLSSYLADLKTSFMVVSHDHAFLDRITNCICDIENCRVKKYNGRYSHFVAQKDQRREAYIRSYTAQKNEIEKIERYIQKNKVRAATAKMARGRQKKLDKIERLAPPTVSGKPQIGFSEIPRSNTRPLTVTELEVGYSFALLPKLSFKMAAGEKLAVTGFNGIGKTTLIKTLAGLIPAISGGFMFDEKVRIAYCEQETQWPDGGMTPMEIISEAYPNLTRKEVRNRLARCGVKAAHALQPVSTLSGGEQSKVKLCKLTMTKTNFLILDEPTNHLDAETKEALRSALEAFEGNLILVSHEAEFYKSIVDGVIDIEKLFD
jgi:ATPase subunit of ABC transporter with duplicated ATPase domains